MWRAVASPVVVGLVASTTSLHPAGVDAAHELGDLQVLGVDPVDRRERAAEHVVEPAILAVRSIGITSEGSSTTQISERSRRSSSQIRHRVALGEVEADLAQPDLLLDLANRVGQAERLGVVGSQDVEGEPLGGALTDPG